MNAAQPGIFAQGARHHYHLEFDLRPDATPEVVGAALAALREPAVTSFREELENVATTTRNLIALAHVLGAVSWQPQITFERKEIM